MENKYRVIYFYLATGMELGPDQEDFGIVEASSPDEAKDIIVKQKFPEEEYYGPNNSWKVSDFFRGCLSAKLITDGE